MPEAIPDIAVVIATHNGSDCLQELLDSINQYGCQHPIFILDTGSTDVEFRKYLFLVKYNYPNLNITVSDTPTKGYDTGAYIHAYNEYPARNYLFMHDSLVVKQENWVEEFSRRMVSGIGAVPWLNFGMCFDFEIERQFLIAQYGEFEDYCKAGIFGPIFYTSRSVLDRMKDQNLFPTIPYDKMTQMATERSWSIAVHKLGLVNNPINMICSDDLLNNDGYTVFKKKRLQRL